MKKKITATLLTTVLMFSFVLSVFGFEVKYTAATPPVINTTQTEENSGNTKYTINYSSYVKDAESIREFMYDTALGGYKSEEALLSSKDAYLTKKTYDYLEISLDNKNWFSLLKCDNNTLSFTLYDNILPTMLTDGIDLTPLCNGFSFYIRVVTASEDYYLPNTETVYVYSPSDSKCLQSSPFGFINVSLPKDAVFTQTLPTFFSGSTQEDIILSIPERQGYVFDGWSIGTQERVNKIPKGSIGVNLESHWIPKVYEINYKINTTMESSFGRADNSNNPVSYTVGTPCAIYDIKSPKINYTFDGWYLSEDFSGEKITEIPSDFTGDVILYAKWISFEQTEQTLREKREKYMTENHYGDIDDDGKITAADARLVLRASVNLENLSYDILKRADYYNTNTISSANARTTLRVCVGLDNLYDILLENGVFPE